jgi:hypothetical protein
MIFSQITVRSKFKFPNCPKSAFTRIVARTFSANSFSCLQQSTASVILQYSILMHSRVHIHLFSVINDFPGFLLGVIRTYFPLCHQNNFTGTNDASSLKCFQIPSIELSLQFEIFLSLCRQIGSCLLQT